MHVGSLSCRWWSVFWVLFKAKNDGAGPDDALLYTQVSLGPVWSVAAALVLNSLLSALSKCMPRSSPETFPLIHPRIGYPPFIRRFDCLHSTHHATSYFSTKHICKLPRRKHRRDLANRGQRKQDAS